jgi:NAD(P)-dependent dehydrogenase (short-subunit alcohol dehydrogenase family)
MMPSVLITGAGRGLGLEFARQYAAEGWRIHACLRDPAKAGALKAIKGDLTIHRLDPCDETQVAALAKALGAEGIDLLVNNAGTYGPRDGAVEKIPYDQWLEVFRLNSIAPLKLARAFLKPVAASRGRVMVFITSIMGSTTQASSGAYPYRMSKAALNMGVKSLAPEFAQRGITAVLFHPGWVRTDMGGAGATLDPTTSIAGMRKVIARLTPADNGRFLSYDGSELPW